MGEIQIVEGRHGRFMCYATDHYIGQSLIRYGEYSEGELLLWEQFIRPGMTVIDVGANIGCFTVPLAQMVGPQGRVFVVEPQRQLYQMLVGTLALNQISNTFVFHGGLGDKPGVIVVPPLDYDTVGNFGGVEMAVSNADEGIRSTMAGERVPCLTLDTLMPMDAQHDVITPPLAHFVKIDTEGMERAVLEGGVTMIRRNKPILYVENDRAEKSAALIEWLMQHDYRCFWHLPPLFNPKNFNGNSDNFVGQIVSINMLCVHRTVALTINGLEEVTTPQAESGVALAR